MVALALGRVVSTVPVGAATGRGSNGVRAGSGAAGLIGAGMSGTPPQVGLMWTLRYPPPSGTRMSSAGILVEPAASRLPTIVPSGNCLISPGNFP
ncbi:hypothetical protein AWC27_01925 [Mycobacterium szulgai]|uniref:Uncharacterized protein n=1 Tax=Mycobacterium szulgai TaxID=1787 RepID=A0A1X2EFR9_MYCSZ|nr:hypothetical protein AWC27_01925 [Mycobacterium szulgai]